MTTVNEAQKQRTLMEHVLSRIGEKLSDREVVCQLCGTKTWNVADQLAVVAVWNVDSGNSISFIDAPGAMPLVMLTCTNCGYVIPINALILGLSDLLDSVQRQQGG